MEVSPLAYATCPCPPWLSAGGRGLFPRNGRVPSVPPSQGLWLVILSPESLTSTEVPCDLGSPKPMGALLSLRTSQGPPSDSGTPLAGPALCFSISHSAAPCVASVPDARVGASQAASPCPPRLVILSAHIAPVPVG